MVGEYGTEIQRVVLRRLELQLREYVVEVAVLALFNVTITTDPSPLR